MIETQTVCTGQSKGEVAPARRLDCRGPERGRGRGGRGIGQQQRGSSSRYPGVTVSAVGAGGLVSSCGRMLAHPPGTTRGYERTSRVRPRRLRRVAPACGRGGKAPSRFDAWGGWPVADALIPPAQWPCSCSRSQSPPFPRWPCRHQLPGHCPGRNSPSHHPRLRPSL